MKLAAKGGKELDFGAISRGSKIDFPISFHDLSRFRIIFQLSYEFESQISVMMYSHSRVRV